MPTHVANRKETYAKRRAEKIAATGQRSLFNQDDEINQQNKLGKTYYRCPDTDLSRLEAFIYQNPIYDLEEVANSLRSHPYVDDDVWQFLLSQQKAYQAEESLGRRHFEAWCEPTWDKTEHALYKASLERQDQIIRLAYDVLERRKPCPANAAAK